MKSVVVDNPSPGADAVRDIEKFTRSTTEPVPTSSELSSPPYPPQDGGIKAWLFLLGACIVEITAWGFPYCYGVFREYFVTHEPFQGDSLVSVGGMLSNASQTPRKNARWLGCLICTGSAIGAAFTTTASALIICLGLLYGIGAGLLFAPSMHFMGDWFVKRKSFAYGIICGAGAAAGAGLPPIYTVCLNKYGAKATLIGWGFITFVVTSIGLLMMQPRTPPERALKPERSDVDFLRKPLFLIFLTATFAQALAHYGPSTYLPSMAADFGLTSVQGSLLVTLLNLAQAIGQPLQGMLADLSSSFYVPFLISTLGGGGVSALLIWPWCRNLWSLSLFSLCFGATAGGFAVLRPRFAAAVVGDDQAAAAQKNSGDASESETTPGDPAAGEDSRSEAEARQRNKSMLIFGVFTAVRGTAVLAIKEKYSVVEALMIYTGVIMLGALGKFVPHNKRFGGK
ncbi:hypothetical protein KVR01_012269 [Diaporthe batatas]|uniref:uncharacterized protein n=1 Tax=Diaporthe batatas TaxID=748121 RepID=UPI001D0500ED|nr:uncharacterized protein KVR01_012269 [Diaporthe batatas]KAG8157997.1 hypothetical protein KVR01_012269 [Diaporthe batatas]